jgi:hypothetical protein
MTEQYHEKQIESEKNIFISSELGDGSLSHAELKTSYIMDLTQQTNLLRTSCKLVRKPANPLQSQYWIKAVMFWPVNGMNLSEFTI